MGTEHFHAAAIRTLYLVLDDARESLVEDPNMESDLPGYARQLEQALLKARSFVGPVEEDKRKGVSLLDAALIINYGDLGLARQKRTAWYKLRKLKLPASIGNCPKHSQVKLFAPSALADFVEKVEGKPLCAECKLLQGLRAIAREPRHSTTPAKGD
jgi:hypothetical protein